MKNIDIITIHCQTNFGSALQAYALCKYINEKGYNCKVIDYRPNYIIHNYGSGIKKYIKYLWFKLSGDKSRKKYDYFIRENIPLTDKQYLDYSELKKENFNADLFIAGSDQLWNVGYTCGKDDSFKLAFVNHANKIAYATSINTAILGKSDIKELDNKIASFKAVSLREKTSVDFFNKELDISAKWVCDPVFLLEKEIYEKFCNNNKYGKYILVYLVDDTEKIRPVVSTIKKRTGYKVLYACGTIPKCDYDIHIKSPGPEEMLTLIKNAEVIITGSFHATSFSHIFHKNFIVIKPNNSERISSLLSISKLEDRMINNVEQCDDINIEVDYSNGQKYLQDFIYSSKEWLDKNLQ